MPQKRIFKKYYNRSMWLLDIEIWYRGERFGLADITGGNAEYISMFVYSKGKGTNVYYDVTGPEDADDNAAVYFKQHSKKAEDILNDYQKACKQLLQFTKAAGSKDFKKIFDLHVFTWAKSVSMYMLSNAVNHSGSVVEKALSARKKTEKFWYTSPIEMRKFAKKLVPQHERYLDVLGFDEIVGGNVPDKQILRKRKQAYIYFDGHSYAGITLDEFAKDKGITILSDKEEINFSENVLTGNIAMKGKAKGKVKVILDTVQAGNIKKGDVLVASMTTPDYLGAMKKAAAYVTDEGGLLCHAAIVAREMKKPCIIGTKIATQVLKDGDLVEVDTNKGVVKIIKRKK